MLNAENPNYIPTSTGDATALDASLGEDFDAMTSLVPLVLKTGLLAGPHTS